MVKRLNTLQEGLRPTAPVHRQRDLDRLKGLVLEAASLIHGLPCAKELEEDLSLAIKGIITMASQTKKLKAALCISDEMDECMG